MSETAFLLFFALLLDAAMGDPKWLWQTVSHPVAWFGKAIDLLEQQFNRATDDDTRQYRNGSLVITGLVLAMVVIGLAINSVLGSLGFVGWFVEVLIVWVFIAQRGLYEHVLDVAQSLEQGGLKSGRLAVSKIVGRDPEMLNETGVSRAAIESLAENFGDGVIAPCFWYLVFGLPGLLAYKMINTADSMIAHKNERFLHFGRTTAQLDDLVNWLPARISALAIAFGALCKNGLGAAKRSMKIALNDSGLHRSPNAGWPEGAMAGATNLALGGPRIYKDEKVAQAYINGAGKMVLGAKDIRTALSVYVLAAIGFGVCVLILALL